MNILTCDFVADRLVLFGNHHDAWVMGAVDPTSGTSVLMEMARVFGEAYKTGKMAIFLSASVQIMCWVNKYNKNRE